MLVGKRALAVLYSFLISQDLRGQRFVLPVNICPSVYWCFIKAGIDVCFCDIDKHTLCLDLELSETIFRQNKCSGVLFNHTYGCSFFPQRDLILFRERNEDCFLINDCCLCPPQIISTKIDSTTADLTLFSTGYAKFLDLKKGGFGYLSPRVRDTPMVHLQFEVGDENLIEHKNRSALDISHDDMATLHWLETTSDFDPDSYFKLITAEFARAVEHKSVLNSIYYQELQGVEQLDADYNNWRFNILVDNQSEVLGRIFGNDLFASSHYLPIIKNSILFPVASALSKRVINLFNDMYFSSQQAIDCSRIIREVSANTQKMFQ